MKNQKYLFFDVETTGVDVAYNHIVQLAAILTDGSGKELGTMNKIIKPNGWLIPEASTAIHGISHKQAVAEGWHLETVLVEFLNLVDDANCLVAHNFNFDFGFLSEELKRESKTGVAEEFGYYKKESICTMNSTTNFVKSSWSNYHQSYKWPRLDELHMKLFGCTFEGAHDALVDVRATVRCFFELKQKHGFYGLGAERKESGYSNRNRK